MYTQLLQKIIIIIIIYLIQTCRLYSNDQFVIILNILLIWITHQHKHVKYTYRFYVILRSDRDPNDYSWVYSTLRFVCSDVRRQNITAVLTFDQPLWWKAQVIVANEPSNSDLSSIVLRLGGFHTEMSFLGCIDHIMFLIHGPTVDELCSVGMQ